MIRLLPTGGLGPDRLAEVHAQAFALPWTADDFAGLCAGALVLAAEEAGRLEGFIMIRVAADEAEILTIAVRPDVRRRGLGLALVEAAQSAAAARGAESLWLEVAADNAAALALYDRAAFDEAGRRNSYYRLADGRLMDAIVMRRALNTAGV
ncbi:MAG TPA: ribosomal protein S18-alanine N-acetyltransferase [Caulobacteraceae bacterium]|jgi:ribosomal-protein-alanine N-acetyltransferase|nr:ribosomal protein S18-alanine N-acetyltransferase [Caulobacteraceae bacterium]